MYRLEWNKARIVSHPGSLEFQGGLMYNVSLRTCKTSPFTLVRMKPGFASSFSTIPSISNVNGGGAVVNSVCFMKRLSFEKK